MKVLYFDQHFGTPEGATGSRSYEFSKALIAAGHTVTMVCGSYERAAIGVAVEEGRAWSRGLVDGIDVIVLPMRYSNSASLARRSVTFLRFALSATMLALREQYDLLFASSTPLTVGIPAIAARILRGRRYVFEVRDLWPELPRALGVTNPLVLGGMSVLEAASYRLAEACIGLAPGIVEGILRRAQHGKLVAMIPNCCDLGLFTPIARQAARLEGAGPGDFVAVFTGAHGPANGLGAVLEGAAVLKQRGNARIKIVLIGDGREKSSLMASARQRGLDNCLFLPPMPRVELAPLVASAGCGLMILKNVPAFYYGTSPNKFFDYISAGIPVLNNYPGWIADLIRENECGLAIEPDAPEALAEALEVLAASPERCRHMGERSRKLAEEQFSRQTLADEFVAFLERCARVPSPLGSVS